MKQIARATSAAPTYFECLKLKASPPVDYFTLIDGGVFANNPSMCAYAEAKKCTEIMRKYFLYLSEQVH